VRSRHPHLWEEQANGPCWYPLDSGTFEVMEGAEVDQQAATVDPPASRDHVSSQRHQGRPSAGAPGQRTAALETAGSGGTPALRFDGVVRRYGTHVALDHLSLQVDRGETVALLGPNGAGKSTTISLFLGLLRPHAGFVEVLGTGASEAVAQGRVGAMLQTGSGSGLPPGVRVSSVLELVRRLYRCPAPFDLTVERAGISDLLDRSTHTLSGGQAQRVRFAVAIAGDPDLIFLDEPTVAMDVDSQRSFWRTMRQFGKEGRTIVFATHHLQEADVVADRVVVINRGRMVANGPGATLKAAVATRQVRFVADDPDEVVLDQMDGVTDVVVRGNGVTLNSLDADATVKALVLHGVDFSDLEVTGAGIEDAFLALTERDPIPNERQAL
jgi:ABC-2 type transport system ATP-binding protein